MRGRERAPGPRGRRVLCNHCVIRLPHCQAFFTAGPLRVVSLTENGPIECSATLKSHPNQFLCFGAWMSGPGNDQCARRYVAYIGGGRSTMATATRRASLSHHCTLISALSTRRTRNGA
jgi:hypothetical protein